MLSKERAKDLLTTFFVLLVVFLPIPAYEVLVMIDEDFVVEHVVNKWFFGFMFIAAIILVLALLWLALGLAKDAASYIIDNSTK